MYTEAEKRTAAKLYSLLYNGANIYNAKNMTKKYDYLGDSVSRFASIVRELNAYTKEFENG